MKEVGVVVSFTDAYLLGLPPANHDEQNAGDVHPHHREDGSQQRSAAQNVQRNEKRAHQRETLRLGKMP